MPELVLVFTLRCRVVEVSREREELRRKLELKEGLIENTQRWLKVACPTLHPARLSLYSTLPFCLAL